ncbi:MAG: hypothetical protein V7K32_19930 [Nostoc sp.]|uniref:hypothetical protein n=1 Tax=Nostoc sp. TaxID=1180 RepID=UPI002FFC12CE
MPTIKDILSSVSLRAIANRTDMKETWISRRRMIQLPGLIIDRHISAPDELEFQYCSVFGFFDSVLDL